jgi:IS5 family transposase
MFMELLARQEEIYGRAPLKAAADGGFASKENLRQAKKQGVRDVAFSKRRGLAVLEMVKSLWVYKKLKNFRAGIEAAISTLKRAFGLSRCTWTGWEGFQQYVWSAVVSYNLAVLGRWKKAAV